MDTHTMLPARTPRFYTGNANGRLVLATSCSAASEIMFFWALFIGGVSVCVACTFKHSQYMPCAWLLEETCSVFICGVA